MRRRIVLQDFRIVALIPARAGSVRVPGKNLRLLAGYPLLAYAIGAAREAGIFERIIVSSEDRATLDVALHYGADLVIRPEEMAASDSPDIAWVDHAICAVDGTLLERPPAAFAILRPTSPFRRGWWIRRAWERLRADPRADSIRAVRLCSEHPAKMWWHLIPGPYMAPVLLGIGEEAPTHSMPTQELPRVYVQTGALEIAWTRVLPGSISGQMVLTYFTAADAPEAIDINEEIDLERSVILAAEHPEYLPPIRTPAGVEG